MAVSHQALLGEELNSCRYHPSVHLLPRERNQPEGVSPTPIPSSEVGHFRLTQMGHFRLTLTQPHVLNAFRHLIWPHLQKLVIVDVDLVVLNAFRHLI